MLYSITNVKLPTSSLYLSMTMMFKICCTDGSKMMNARLRELAPRSEAARRLDHAIYPSLFTRLRVAADGLEVTL